MASDTEPNGAGTSGVVVPVATQSSSRPERALGRGLEDVSHLFLSQKQDAPTGRAREREEQSPPAPASPAPVLLRSVRAIARDRFGAALRDLAGAIESGLRGIDANLPAGGDGEIDMLAVDEANQLAIVDFETTASDGLLLRGMAHVDWAAHNLRSLQRMYPGQTIDFSAPPRLFLVAPEFSPRLQSAARQIVEPRVHYVRFRLFETPEGTGIFFER